MTNLEKMCLEISNTTKRTKLKNIASELSECFNKNRTSDLKKISDLVFWLYILDQKKESFDICLELKDLDLTNDEDKNTYIESIYMLFIALLEEKSEFEQANFYKEKIIAVYRPKTLKRILNGSSLYYDEIKRNKEQGNIESVYEWQYLQFRKLIFIRSLGGSEVYPVNKIDLELEELRTELSK